MDIQDLKGKKGEKYLKVLALLKEKGRVSLVDPDLLALLDRGDKKNLAYRMTTYVSYIRRFAKIEVKALRTGRVAWAYELIPIGEEQGEKIYKPSKYATVTPPVDNNAA